ncbi:fibronectin type III domain-containing protein [bacterium]|nr:fibronectin type III domain-containing protein [bacterium]
MLSSNFSADNGYFTIANMNIGDVIGNANMTTNNANFITTLTVSSIISSNEIIVQSQDITGLILGTFTITNTNPGVTISAQSVPDNNNVTSGNVESVTFNNVFTNPSQGNIIFTSTIISELSDTDIQSFIFNINCPCVIDSVTYSYSSCDSYIWNGITYINSGNYSWIGTNVDGCDSIVSLYLTINSSTNSNTNITECNSYTWNNNTYTLGGTYTYNTTNSNGCDSLAILNLTINTSIVSTINITECDSYTWNGTTYTTSGTYTYNTINSNGCDSTIHLNLIINNTSTSISNTVLFTPYSWNGVMYTSSGTYTYNTINSNGCDSIATLILSILNCNVPSNITTNNITLNSVDLAWDTNPAAYAYKVKYREVSSTIWIIDTVYTNGLSLSSLSNTTSYNWKVKSICDINWNNVSSWSLQQQFTTLTPCQDPYNLSVFQNQTTTNSFKVSWNGSSSTVLYEVLLRDVNASSWDTLLVTNSGVTSTNVLATSTMNGSGTYVTLKFNNLNSSTNYEWRVLSQCSNNGTNTSNYVNGINVTTNQTCQTPLGLTATNIMFNQATINWNPVSGAIKYEVRKRVLGGAWNYIIVYSNSRTFYGLSSSTSYEWGVRTICNINGSNNSSWSSNQLVTTLLSCQIPTNLNENNITSSSTNLTWDVNPSAYAYKIKYREVSSTIWIIDTVYTNGLSLSSLSNTTSYNWKVKSICDINWNNVSSWSSQQQFTTLTPCQDPYNLSVFQNQTTTNSFKVSWNGSSSTVLYEVLLRDVNASSWDTLLVTNSGVTSTNVLATSTMNGSGTYVTLKFNNLNSSTNYEWRVLSQCSNNGTNTSNYVNGINVTTNQTCQTPLGLTTTYIINNRSDIEWNLVTGAVKYEIRKRVLGGTWTYLTEYSNSRTLCGLSTSNIYEWGVRTICNTNGTNVSNWSSTQSISIPPICSQPVNLSTNNITSTSANLSWDIHPAAQAYKIKWKEIGSPVNVVIDTNNFISISNLSPNSNYKWKIRTICDSIFNNLSAFTSWQYFNTSSSIRISDGHETISKNLNVYPNPTKGVFYISFISDEITRIEVSVSNTYGKNIFIDLKKMFIGEYTKKLDLTSFNKGVYLLQIRTNNSFTTKKIVIQ